MLSYWNTYAFIYIYTSLLLIVITHENIMMIQWHEHREKGVMKRTNIEQDRQVLQNTKYRWLKVEAKMFLSYLPTSRTERTLSLLIIDVVSMPRDKTDPSLSGLIRFCPTNNRCLVTPRNRYIKDNALMSICRNKLIVKAFYHYSDCVLLCVGKYHRQKLQNDVYSSKFALLLKFIK